MAVKDENNRLTLKSDFILGSGLCFTTPLIFALTTTKEVVIIAKYDFDKLNQNHNENLEFLGTCSIAEKVLSISFVIPENVESALNTAGDEYYFSAVRKFDAVMVFIRKNSTTSSNLFLEGYDILLDKLDSLLDKADAYLEKQLQTLTCETDALH